MAIKVLIKRDTLERFKTTSWVPREFELVVAYDDKSDGLIYKLGDGKTHWNDLPEITKISELDQFLVYTKGSKPVVEAYLTPSTIDKVVKIQEMR